MKRHFAYFKYVLRHKWFVLWACRMTGAGLRRGAVHDWTKFLPREWFAYAKHFYNEDGTRRDVRDKTGSYDPLRQGISFEMAWLSHQRNKHHWQAWVVLGDGGSVKALPMPEKYVREMVADWVGAGKAISGRSDPRPWYDANKWNMLLHDETRDLVEMLLEELFA